MTNPLPRDFYLQPTVTVAHSLLGTVLVRRFEDDTIATGRIVETEAYTTDDPASHAFRGPTKRNEVMFGSAGHAYIYLNYGIHYCLNAVTGAEGCGEAVLIRGIEPLENASRLNMNYFGPSLPMDEEAARSDRRLGAGPGRLTRALAIGPAFNGIDLTDAAGPLWIAEGGVPDDAVVTTTRIGITKGAEKPWRFYVAGSRFVSKK